MPLRTSSALASGIGACTLLSGCGRPAPTGAPETLAFETEHVAYYAEGPVCEDLADWFETIYAAVTEWTGVDPSRRVRYFAYGDDTSIDEPCSGQSGGDGWGCYAPPGDVVANVTLHREMFARALLDDAGDPPAFFESGLAQMLGPWSAGGEDGVPHDVDLVGMVRGDVDAYYGVPADFVRYLTDTYGRGPFLRFYAEAPWDPKSEAFDAAFADAFGASLATVAAEWASWGDGERGDAWMWLPECGYDRMPPELDAPDMTCAGHALDANETPGVGTFRTTQLADGAAIHVTATSDAWAGVTVTGCSSQAEGGPELWLPDDAATRQIELWASVHAGDYFLGLQEAQQTEPSGGSRFTFEVVPSPNGATCAEAGHIPVGASAGELLSGATGPDGAWFVWLDPTVTTTLSIEGSAFNPFAASGPAQALVCTGMCDVLTCVQAPVDIFYPYLDVVAGTPVLLELELPPSTTTQVLLNRRD